MLMRIGELMGLQWSDVDFEKKVVHVRRSLCYFRKDGKYVFEWHDTKTHNSKRTIPLTTRAMEALKKQRVRGQEILLKNAQTAQDEFRRNTRNLRGSLLIVSVTPLQQGQSRTECSLRACRSFSDMAPYS